MIDPGQKKLMDWAFLSTPFGSIIIIRFKNIRWRRRPMEQALVRREYHLPEWNPYVIKGNIELGVTIQNCAYKENIIISRRNFVTEHLT